MVITDTRIHINNPRVLHRYLYIFSKLDGSMDFLRLLHGETQTDWRQEEWRPNTARVSGDEEASLTITTYSWY